MEVIYATTNELKLTSARKALAATKIRLVQPKTKLPDVPEIQSDDQEEVAVDKAKKYYAILGCPLVVMDGGLFVDSLKGFPGVYTKYVIDTIGAEGITGLLRKGQHRSAYTQRTVVYCDGDVLQSFTMRVEGSLATLPRGDGGRDYDRFFIVGDTGKTIAELTDDEKTAMVADVWLRFAAWLTDRG